MCIKAWRFLKACCIFHALLHLFALLHKHWHTHTYTRTQTGSRSQQSFCECWGSSVFWSAVREQLYRAWAPLLNTQKQHGFPLTPFLSLILPLYLSLLIWFPLYLKSGRLSNDPAHLTSWMQPASALFNGLSSYTHTYMLFTSGMHCVGAWKKPMWLNLLDYFWTRAIWLTHTKKIVDQYFHLWWMVSQCTFTMIIRC